MGAKLADLLGRWEMLCVSLVFYLVGTIVESTASNIQTLAGGAVLFQFGYTFAFVLRERIYRPCVELTDEKLCSPQTSPP